MDAALEIALRVLSFLAAALILRSAVARIREGSFSLYGTPVERSKNPYSFWVVVVVALLGAAWFIVLGIR